jgi:hypothetical protein
VLKTTATYLLDLYMHPAAINARSLFHFFLSFSKWLPNGIMLGVQSCHASNNSDYLSKTTLTEDHHPLEDPFQVTRELYTLEIQRQPATSN